ncbi:MAG TPA: hypothetical protein PKA64_25345 [Myxococcota bacterium]|nr:hypothetical protein [Myxococcota bacterium]
MPRSETSGQPSLQQIQEQLTAILEERVTELMAQIKTTQALSRQIARTEEEVERQRLLQEKLEAEVGPLREEAAALHKETAALQAEVDDLLSKVASYRSSREGLMALKLGSSEGTSTAG